MKKPLLVSVHTPLSSNTFGIWTFDPIRYYRDCSIKTFSRYCNEILDENQTGIYDLLLEDSRLMWLYDEKNQLMHGRLNIHPTTLEKAREMVFCDIEALLRQALDKYLLNLITKVTQEGHSTC